MARPRPVPPKRRDVEPSACSKARNRRSRACRLDADAGVDHARRASAADALAMRRDRQAQRDAAALGELDGVAEQVDQHLPQAMRIAEHAAAAARAASRRASTSVLRSAAGATMRQRLLHDVGHVEAARSRARSLPASIFEKSRMSLMTCSRCSADSCTTVAHSRCSGVERRVEQQRRHAQHAVHRRADLVAHAGEELALGAGRGLGGVARLPHVALMADARGGVREEPGGAAVEREDPELEHALDAVDGDRDGVRRGDAAGVDRGGRGRQRRRERRQSGVEPLADEIGARQPGGPLRRDVPRLDAAVPAGHEQPFVDRRDDAAQARLGPLRRLQPARPLHHAQHHQRQELHDAEHADDAHQGAGRQRRDGGELGLGAAVLPRLDPAQRFADALEGRSAFGQVAGHGLGGAPLEDRRDDLVAAAQILGPRAIEVPHQPVCLVGVPGRRQLARDRGDAGVGAARAIDVTRSGGWCRSW